MITVTDCYDTTEKIVKSCVKLIILHIFSYFMEMIYMKALSSLIVNKSFIWCTKFENE